MRLLRLLVLRLLLPRHGISGLLRLLWLLELRLLRLLELRLLRLLELRLLRLLLPRSGMAGLLSQPGGLLSQPGGLLPGLCVDSRAATGTELCIAN